MDRKSIGGNKVLTSITRIGLATLFAACSGSEEPGGAANTTSTGGTAGSSGGTSAKGGTAGAAGGSTGGSTGGGTTAGNTGTGGNAGAASGTGGGTSGSAGLSTGGSSGGTGGAPPTAGSAGTGGSDAGGQAGTAGTAGTAEPRALPTLVTSAEGAYWNTTGMLTDSTAAATVTVNDTAAQTWEGFGGSFNELGWSYLTSQEMKDAAIRYLFSAADGCNFVWGRIPMGASDYARTRYTLDDLSGADPAPNGGEAARPAGDSSLAGFSLARDEELLIPYIKAAQVVKPSLRFWASPWTPPIWMKTGFKTNSGADSSQNAVKPSYFDGGNMQSDALASYAQYFVKFVEGYKGKGIDIEVVSPQNEPGYDQNYPSCLWDQSTYTTFIGQHLGPAMMPLGVRVMLGTMSNQDTDIAVADAVLANATARGYLSVAGAQWGVLTRVNEGYAFGGLPIWATEHKCGNYPWGEEGYPPYNNTQAPNDHAYGVESWDQIRNAIKRGKVTAYSAWNMVLDRLGRGNDTTRDWKQNALLVANDNQVTPTPAYHVFRHLAQYVAPGATVLGTTGGDALAFRNTDDSVVAVMFNDGVANPNYVVKLGGKTLAFAMPGDGWATVMVRP